MVALAGAGGPGIVDYVVSRRGHAAAAAAHAAATPLVSSEAATAAGSDGGGSGGVGIAGDEGRNATLPAASSVADESPGAGCIWQGPRTRSLASRVRGLTGPTVQPKRSGQCLGEFGRFRCRWGSCGRCW